MKDFDCEVRYYKGEKEIRRPVQAYSGEGASSHTRICRTEWGGDRIEASHKDGVCFEIATKKDLKGTLGDLFKLERDKHVESVLLI